MSPSSSASASLSPSSSVSSSASPSSSVSPSPSQFIIGIETDIIAIKQVDNLTVIRTPNTDITIYKAIDEITIKDIEDILSGSSPIPVEITIRKQSDDIVITQVPDINLTIRD